MPEQHGPRLVTHYTCDGCAHRQRHPKDVYEVYAERYCGAFESPVDHPVPFASPLPRARERIETCGNLMKESER